MDTYQSHLQEDGTTFPPVTPDAPMPPGVDLPDVPDPESVAPETPADAADDAGPDADAEDDAPD